MTSFDIAHQIDNSISNRNLTVSYDNFIKGAKKDKSSKIKGLWGDVFGGNSRQDTREQESGYDSKFGGVTFGFDDILASDQFNHILGGAISYGQAQANDRSISNQETNIDAYQLSLYNYNVGNREAGLFNENLVSLGYNRYDSSRSIAVNNCNARAKSEFSAMQYGVKTGVGYNFKTGKSMLIAPIASIKYSGLALDDYQEKDADGAGLKVKNSYFHLLTSDVGVKVIDQLTPTLSAQFNTSWSRNLQRDGSKSTTSFIGNVDGSTTSVGTALLKDFFNIGTQLNIKNGQDTLLMIKYELQAGNNFVSNLVSLRYNLIF